MMNRRTALRGLLAAPALARTAGLKLSTFAVDVTPPLGAPLCFSLVEPVKSVAAPLWAKGVALYPEGQLPIVLVAVDWLGIGGASYRDWQSKLASALRTTPDRVAIHTVHQHDAPGSYRDAHARLAPLGLGALLAPEAFCSAAVDRVAAALRAAPPQTVSAIGWGQARVEGIASNRRIVGPDGKFLFQRFTTCRNSEYCQAPDGVIDPYLRTVSFHGDKKRLATLHYYATHPMSLYGQGHVSGDFVGDAREALPGFHVYFTGAAGNIGAGKYNDGAPTRRAELAAKLRRAMESAIEHEERTRTLDLRWKSAPVLLPQRSGPEHQTAALEKKLNDASTLPRDRASAARFLAWQAACQARQPISLSALAWEGGQVVHMPGELFVEYQLAAQAEAPGQSIAMAAYGDYGPMYIGTAKSYAEGGYETSWVSRVDPPVEEILKNAVRGLLKG